MRNDKTRAAADRLKQGNFHIPSPEEVKAAESGNGGWSAIQLAEWGIAWPPKSGWRKELERRYCDQKRDKPMPTPTRIGLDDERVDQLLDLLQHREGFVNFTIMADELRGLLSEVKRSRERPLHCAGCDGDHL